MSDASDRANRAMERSGMAGPAPAEERTPVTAAAGLPAEDARMAALVHELRGPLAPISNALALLQRCVEADAQARWCHEVLQRQVGRLTRVLDDFAEASQLARGRLALQLQPVLLDDVLRAAADDAQADAQAADGRLRLVGGAAAARLHADPRRLAQALSRVLAHALGRAGGAAVVVVAAELTPRHAVLRVHGGAPAAATPRPAQPPAPRAARPAGEPPPAAVAPPLPPGLALAQALLALHGGTLVVPPGGSGEGDGGAWEVRLPLATAEVTDAGAPKPIEEA